MPKFETLMFVEAQVQDKLISASKSALLHSSNWILKKWQELSYKVKNLILFQTDSKEKPNGTGTSIKKEIEWTRYKKIIET